MRRSKISDWKHYGVAVLSVAGAVFLTFAISPLFTYRSPAITFTLAVIASAWVGGLGPGLAATVLGFWKAMPGQGRL